MNRHERITRLRDFSDELETMLAGLSDTELTTAYLDGEWTVAQNIHHLADSHMNSYIRFKLVLVEDHPTFKPYDQEDWARLTDAASASIAPSLAILRGVHTRWADLMDTLDDDVWSRSGYHPENDADVTLDDLLVYYSDHCDAHIDQIQRTLAAK